MSGPKPSAMEGLPAASAARARARLLVADDEDGTLSLLTTILVHAGYSVTPARDGLEALQRAREAPPDLVLLDVMMPRMDGREVCRRMCADPRLTHVPVILNSSADERDIDWRGCGADAFLQKPFSTHELPELVRQTLSARPRAARPAARPLTDAEVLDVAHRIRDAVRQPPTATPRDGVLSPYHELGPEDEARVEAALLTLFRSPGGDASAAQTARNSESARHPDAQRGTDTDEG